MWLCWIDFAYCLRQYSCLFLCHFGLLWRVVSLAIILHFLFYVENKQRKKDSFVIKIYFCHFIVSLEQSAVRIQLERFVGSHSLLYSKTPSKWCWYYDDWSVEPWNSTCTTELHSSWEMPFRMCEETNTRTN